jgi:signal transduction histidine kinase
LSSFLTDRDASVVGSTQILYAPDTIRQQYLSMIKAATSEILMILPTINAIQREHDVGVIEELKKAVRRGVKIRLLSAEDEFIKEKLDQLRASGIVVRRIETPTETKFKMLSVDRRFSLVVETKDDTKKSFQDAIGVAIFSNSNATVAPFVTIFETLWRETDLYEKTHEAERIKDEFVNIAAHELRNPIMPILQGSESLHATIERIKDKLSPAEYEELHSDSSLVIRNIMRLIKLTEDILQVSRLESGSFTLNIRNVDLEKVILSVITDIKKKYSDKMDSVKIIYERRDGTEPLILACDESKIEQCVHNLLDNAVKFTNAGEVIIGASLSLEEMILQVRDSGIGIDKQVKDRLFEKFVTKSEGGTGLGLYVTKKIILAHGGRISGIPNKDGVGSTFAFSIPRNLSANASPLGQFRPESESSIFHVEAAHVK